MGKPIHSSGHYCADNNLMQHSADLPECCPASVTAGLPGRSGSGGGTSEAGCAGVGVGVCMSPLCNLQGGLGKMAEYVNAPVHEGLRCVRMCALATVIGDTGRTSIGHNKCGRHLQ
ncbi:unnamed protein product [Protopolystoma xenopodis]|uniref:Uncharacterized protein n=1 Tax=Protopolystoma xenopodis TaxID=117903 RepID=A0A3S5CRQ7_9PLAT|nr:unnamed protein product [Protopolystoma xenopodis]